MESWEDIDSAIRALQRKESQGGVPLSGAQTGEGDVYPMDFEDVPLDMIPFNSESEMFEFLKKTADQSFNIERKREAEKLLSQLVRQHSKQGGTYELEGSLGEALRDKKKRKFKKVNG